MSNSQFQTVRTQAGYWARTTETAPQDAFSRFTIRKGASTRSDPHLTIGSQVKGDPGGIVITAVTGVFGAAIDPGFAQVVLQSRAQPDLIEQLVARRLA